MGIETYFWEGEDEVFRLVGGIKKEPTQYHFLHLTRCMILIIRETGTRSLMDLGFSDFLVWIFGKFCTYSRRSK